MMAHPIVIDDLFDDFHPLIRGMVYSSESTSYASGYCIGMDLVNDAEENASYMNAILNSGSYTEEGYLELMYANAISNITKSKHLGEVIFIPREYVGEELYQELKRADLSRGILDALCKSLEKKNIIKK